MCVYVCVAHALQDSDLKQYWMPDSQCKECYDCNEKFTTFRRRHHCRLCGQIFCSRCCNQEIPGKFMGYTGECLHAGRWAEACGVVSMCLGTTTTTTTPAQSPTSLTPDLHDLRPLLSS